VDENKKTFDVVVVGELNMDLILYGLPETLEPEHEHLAEAMALTLGSSSAIFAHNLAVLGSRVGFISRIGDDLMGEAARRWLAEGGVDTSGVRRVPRPALTGLTVILARRADRNILTYPGTIFELCYDDLDFKYVNSARHFHMSSFFLHRALRPRMREAFAAVKRAGLTISLDTNDDPDDCWDANLSQVLEFVDVMLVNERECMKLAGTQDVNAAVERLAGRVPLVVVKLGGQGALARRGKDEWRAQGLQVEAVDSVGAGDSFDAGFIHQYIRGAEVETCLRFGNLAGALSVTRAGGTGAFRDRSYADKFQKEHWPLHQTHEAAPGQP
jgi:sugar/nucleoside kinase (ribokinase family)